MDLFFDDSPAWPFDAREGAFRAWLFLAYGSDMPSPSGTYPDLLAWQALAAPLCFPEEA
jgi:hypothetical protein